MPSGRWCRFSESPERLNSRNGYRARNWDARAGSVELKIPKLRQGSYVPGFLKATAYGREGAHGRHPGGLCAGPSPPAR